MRSQFPNKTEATKKLQADFKNGPYHCFGVHNNCRIDFCITAKKQQKDEGISEDRLPNDKN